MKTTINKWASVIASLEGKKHQASVGDIREILKIIIEMDAKGSDILDDLCLESDNMWKKLNAKKKK